MTTEQMWLDRAIDGLPETAMDERKQLVSCRDLARLELRRLHNLGNMAISCLESAIQGVRSTCNSTIAEDAPAATPSWTDWGGAPSVLGYWLRDHRGGIVKLIRMCYDGSEGSGNDFRWYGPIPWPPTIREVDSELPEWNIVDDFGRIVLCVRAATQAEAQRKSRLHLHAIEANR